MAMDEKRLFVRSKTGKYHHPGCRFGKGGKPMEFTAEGFVETVDWWLDMAGCGQCWEYGRTERTGWRWRKGAE